MGEIRVFESGATRDGDTWKYDYEGFLSPLALERYGQYMHQNRFQTDGNMRESDNWQRSIPLPVYMKSLLRHVMEVWLIHRGYRDKSGLENSLAAVMFNTMGYLHEHLKEVHCGKNRQEG